LALGNGKKGVTITLAVLAGGSKLLPYVIYYHKTMSKEQVHSGITDVHLTTQVQATTKATISSINIDLVVVPEG
jgi:peptidase E